MSLKSRISTANDDETEIDIRVANGMPEVHLPGALDWEKCVAYAAIRQVEGDHFCILKNGESILRGKGMADPEGTVSTIAVENDLLMLDRGRTGSPIGRYLFLPMKRTEIRRFLFSTMSRYSQTAPIRLASKEEMSRAIELNVGGVVKGGCYYCGPHRKNTAFDACSFCGRLLCREHQVLCVTMELRGQAGGILGFCEECAYFFLGVTPKKDPAMKGG